MALALAWCLAGCSSTFLRGDVELLTGVPDDCCPGWANRDGTLGCVLMGPTGELIADRRFGTVFRWGDAVSPVMWPVGYTGRWVGWEVEVLDASQDFVALTGMTWELLPANTSMKPGEVFIACGDALVAGPRIP